MAHFTKLNNNRVVEVITVDDDVMVDLEGQESETIGIAYLQRIFGVDTVWKQTSYNNRMRGNYAGIGYTYMTDVATLGVGSTDIFIQTQPYPSWSIGVNTARWYAPIPEPGITSTQKSNGEFWQWNEAAYQADTGNPKTVGWALTS
tara:strand:- start:946 stop:1383 length:438 start_codon:yes stop_codon:yes gene_type:complete